MRDEFTPLPKERDGGIDSQEFFAPGPEFDGSVKKGREKKKGKKRWMLAAAALILYLGIYWADVLPDKDGGEEPPVSQGGENTVPDKTQTSASQFQTPDSTEEPAHKEAPDCTTVFIITSDPLSARMHFTGSEAIRSARAELWDIEADRVEQEWEVPLDAIASGSYELPDMLSVFDIFMKYHDAYDPNEPFPVPELRTYVEVEDEGGIHTLEERLAPAEELGWSVRDTGDELLFATYETLESYTFLPGNGEEEPASIGEKTIVVSVRDNGTLLQKDSLRAEEVKENWFDSTGALVDFNFYYLHIPKNNSHGHMEITVKQRLTGYDYVWEKTIEKDY